MSNKLRKQDCARARGQKHRDKRAQKRESARAYSQPTPKSQRQGTSLASFLLQFPQYKPMARSKAV